MPRICVIDDNDLMRDSVCQTLVAADYEAVGIADPADGLAALTALAADPFDLVITDLKMPGLDGVELLRRLRESGCELPVILMTAFGTVQSAVEAMKLGAFDYLTKPFQGDELEIVVERALAHRRLERVATAYAAQQADQARERPVVAESEPMKRVMDQVARLADSAATVLVTGESGTGKELVARAIHAAGPRSAAPMLAVNCAALSASLLESELFGHEKGAFTGADRMRRGRFELADGGTLLLDEIGELDDRLQAKLLRVLQEREFERVGSSLPRRVDVRVIATTNRPLAAWVEQGKFRRDLYYRLSVLPIHLPALRDRPADVLPLARATMARIAGREGRAVPQLTESAERMLLDYRWPGNVRELENLMERCATLSEDGVIDERMLGRWLGDISYDEPAAGVQAAGCDTRSMNGSYGILDRPAASAAGSGGDSFGTLDGFDGQLMDEMERRLIFTTLRRFEGHRGRTADALGIGLRTLGLKLKKYRETGRYEPTHDARVAVFASR